MMDRGAPPGASGRGSRRLATGALAGLASVQAPAEGYRPEDPGWTVAVPAIVFLVLAVIAWWLWRWLADR